MGSGECGNEAVEGFRCWSVAVAGVRSSRSLLPRDSVPAVFVGCVVAASVGNVITAARMIPGKSRMIVSFTGTKMVGLADPRHTLRLRRLLLFIIAGEHLLD